MSKEKWLPKGLRDEDVERAPVDPIKEAVDAKTSTTKFKVTLTDGTIVYHNMYDN